MSGGSFEEGLDFDDPAFGNVDETSANRPAEDPHRRWAAIQLIEEGMSASELVFLLAWYGDTKRVGVMLTELAAQGQASSELRFGKHAALFSSRSYAPLLTLIHVAAVRDKPEIVRMLAGLGHAVDARVTEGGHCPSALELVLAVDEAYGTIWTKESLEQMGLLLLAKGATPSRRTLSSAISLRSLLLVQAMLDKGADPNAMLDGRTLLHQATLFHVEEEIVLLLVEEGANPYLKNGDGMTSLDLAGRRAPSLARKMEEAWRVRTKGGGGGDQRPPGD